MTKLKENVKKVKVTWVKSTIGRPEKQKRIMSALGFKKLNSSIEHYFTPTIVGMINKVTHLVQIEDI